MSKNNINTDWLKILTDCGMELLDISDRLNYYSNSFYTTGNTKMGDSLAYIAERLNDMSQNISKASGIVTSNMVNSSTQNSWNVLQAALAGVKIATKEE